MKLRHIIFSILAMLFGITSGVQQSHLSQAQQQIDSLSAQVDEMRNDAIPLEAFRSRDD